jgi:hypothetical protein
MRVLDYWVVILAQYLRTFRLLLFCLLFCFSFTFFAFFLCLCLLLISFFLFLFLVFFGWGYILKVRGSVFRGVEVPTRFDIS